MNKVATITCAFCKGTGKHPHFGSTCPVCKGKGKNAIVGPFMLCRDCRGTGQKSGTTLTCYTCGGLGVIPDTREEVEKARKEIRKARAEMDKERQEFREKPQPAPPPQKADQPLAGKKRTKKKIDKKKEIEETVTSNACPPKPAASGAGRRESEGPKEGLFCQCCGSKVKKESTIKVCLDCFRKLKEVWRENIFTES